MDNMQHNILKKIKGGEVDMKPKWHFVLRAGLLFFGAIIVALLSVYLVSFVFFFMHQSGIVYAPGFGFAGLVFFAVTSPWLLIGASVAFLIILYLLVKRFSFSYQRPLLYSMLAVIVLALLGSWLIQQTPMHQRVSEFMERNNVPVFAPLYRDVEQKRPEGLIVGTVTEVTDTGFTLDSERDGVVEVRRTERTRMKPGMEVEVGARFMVFGDRSEGTITAFGVRFHKGERMKQRFESRDQEGQIIRSQKDKPDRPPLRSRHEE